MTHLLKFGTRINFHQSFHPSWVVLQWKSNSVVHSSQLEKAAASGVFENKMGSRIF